MPSMNDMMSMMTVFMKREIEKDSRKPDEGSWTEGAIESLDGLRSMRALARNREKQRC